MQTKYYCIAGVNLKICGPIDLINQAFELFEFRELREDDDYIEWIVEEDIAPEPPAGGERIADGEFDILKTEDSMWVFYPEDSGSRIELIKYEENMQKATFYIPHYGDEHDWEYFFRARQSFFEASLDAFCMALLKRGGIAIPSASVSYRGHGLVLANEASTTKTEEHAKMWASRYGAEVLDGDVAMCRVVLGKLRVYGLPWALRSGARLNKDVPLSGIVFIQDGKKDKVSAMSRESATVALSNMSITPSWFKDIYKERYIVAKRIVIDIPCCLEAQCASLIETTEMIRKKLDAAVE